jgi:hypothetical protein
LPDGPAGLWKRSLDLMFHLEPVAVSITGKERCGST